MSDEKKPTKEDFEKRATKKFFENKKIIINDEDIVEYKDKDSAIDVTVANQKIQVRHMDDELAGKFWSGKGFFGSRDFQKILEIIINAIKTKDEKYQPPNQTQDIILLLD